MLKKLIVVLSLLSVILISGCGKYSKPLPPEDYAPANVGDLTVTATSEGVAFNWSAPRKNTRGLELKELDGYKVYRRELEQSSRLIDPTVKFDLIGEIEDTHLKEITALKQQAIEQGQISRKVSLPDERSKFAFVDRKVSPGKRYFYQIVPINQGGVEGQFLERIDVTFKGELSEIVRVPYSAEEFEF